MRQQQQKVYAVVPAAGIGKRMGAALPKQYLNLDGRPILSHTLSRLLAHPDISQVVVALSPRDTLFDQLAEAGDDRVRRVDGGGERADSVLAALNAIDDDDAWVMVHDAARPCLRQQDITRLLQQAGTQGGILAAPVRDTMKRATAAGDIDHTVERQGLWHALTPQLFPLVALREALAQALAQQASITDEASAMERVGWQPTLVEGCISNMKVTHPDDLRMAELLIKEL
ncbi:2-C-methyl-D-erythritol 4-phosphate cytidylyltransferase [Ferrimonas sediminum]|uniref:2-C-methyl-D-erythritol 4-phosphate cytidylyltransferase n=1 Tax=Ferrimonas sediminum TaxID=718193 RepID=A0A1G8PLM7_9GAMM|nr:2-C-methyl-D-erythritol 4-phosphate cytidylyltransferase [Ferrimonas sediminum]SDI93404.1 2-C-methyl-D-erythritol 4-phosphate cytidylyltransferase [Ferrimonas sediminum]